MNNKLKNTLQEILKHISAPGRCGKTKCLSSLNAFVKFLQHAKCPRTWQKEVHGFDFAEICLCLRVCLIDETIVIRVAALRVLRYLVNNEDDLNVINSVGIPFLVARSLDIVLNNAGERHQAIRFCQKLLSFPFGAKLFPVSILRALISIATDGVHDQDKIHHASLSILCQLVLISPLTFINSGGVRVMIQNLLIHTTPALAEAILSGLLQLLNMPETRNAVDLSMLPLIASFTDHHFKLSSVELSSRHTDEREMGYRCSKTAIGIILRSWNGITHLCQEDHNGFCELQALVDSLYIEQLEVRKTILDLVCEIVGLQFPTWTDEMSVAVTGVDLVNEKSAWKLQEGFVVEEALSVLPHLASVTPNVKVNHMALLIYCFTSKGLLDALVEVIVTSDTFISVRATMLLGEFLSLIDRFLPTECFDPSKCIPALIQYAASPSKMTGCSLVNAQMKQHRAMEAITVLSSIRKQKTKTAIPFSTFLQVQVTFAGYQRKYSDDFVDRLGELQLNRLLGKDIESGPAKLLKETSVLTSKDPMSWQWETICTMFRWCPISMRRVEDSNWRLFLRRLVDFYKPSNNLFARIEKGNEGENFYVKVGCNLVEFLADQVQNFYGTPLLDELLADIAAQLDDLLNHSENPHDANWNPKRMETTLSQSYFIFIGLLTKNFTGSRTLEMSEILPRLLNLTIEMKHDYYIKLIISSLNYGEEFCRRILKSALTSTLESVRDYATHFLRVLVRIKPPDFSKWGIEFLVSQLKDTSPVISRAAMNILEEAIHDKMFLESLISLRPALLHLGDRGRLILVAFLSLPSGCKLILEANFLKKEVDKWRTSFNLKYVDIVEVMLRDAFSTLKRGYDGKYPKRASMVDEQHLKLVDTYLPTHLYGQLAQHKFGLDILIEMGQIYILIKMVKSRKWETQREIRELKAAFWALSHTATSAEALPILEESNVIDVMVRIARTCPVLSVRHTVFHCLCLISSTSTGAEYLRRLGWHSLPRTHHDVYPIWRLSEPWISTLLDDELELDSVSIGKISTYSKTESDSNVLLEEDQVIIAGNSQLEQQDVDDLSLKDFSATSWSAANPNNITLAPNINSAYFRDKLKPTSFRLTDLEEKGSICRSLVLEEDTLEAEEDAESSMQSISDKTDKFSEIGRRNSTSTSIVTSRSLNIDLLTDGTKLSQFENSQFGSPTYSYRSVIRKPKIRMPVLSDPDLYPPHPSPQGRLSLRELKVGSLDRHCFISPADLFNESKLTRQNTSMTSLSTPSFRAGPGTELKGPCFMGLCLPKELDMIFRLDSEKLNGESVLHDSTPVKSMNYEELHTSATCLAQLHLEPSQTKEYKFRSEADLSIVLEEPIASTTDSKTAQLDAGIRFEIIRHVSSMISSVGAKTNEQSLLRLKQQYAHSFQNLCTYTEVCVMMSRYNIRSAFRRFIQELFYDLCYDEFRSTAAELLQGQDKGSALTNLGKSVSIEEPIQEEVAVVDIHVGENVDGDFIHLK